MGGRRASHAVTRRPGRGGHTVWPAAAVLGAWTTPIPVRHTALQEALALLPQLLDGPARLTDPAATVGLSASRLGHLFAGELALPFPAFMRWNRLRRAMEPARDGTSLTQAAHGAGFADSSHLNRTCHEMLGLAPSHLLSALHPTPGSRTGLASRVQSASADQRICPSPPCCPAVSLDISLDRAIKTMRDTGRGMPAQGQGHLTRRPGRQRHRVLTPVRSAPDGTARGESGCRACGRRGRGGARRCAG
ncbi:helix-turn-helix domain-containing protein [Thermoactinospora rubra]|uniref:helix-turn-helix domain-containing protein n=1 Tax=Thermoactinospora rubra TaxID=1088767 RepID=UPI000A0F9362